MAEEVGLCYQRSAGKRPAVSFINVGEIAVLVLLFAGLSFTLSASAGMGGSLILVPALSLLLGAKQGIALSALLLTGNNLAKLAVYRRTVPLKAILEVLVLLVAGSILGARLLLAAPEHIVHIAIIASLSSAFLLEQVKFDGLGRGAAMLAAFFAGATSGFSGTSGPLKGLSLRRLSLDRLHYVGAASAASLAGDLMKTAVFANGSLLDEQSWTVMLWAIPLMPLAAFVGWRLNRRIGERAFAALFWTVMAGYSLRLLLP
jgi:hypothetical protein